jgi:hypothetical protein
MRMHSGVPSLLPHEFVVKKLVQRVASSPVFRLGSVTRQRRSLLLPLSSLAMLAA